MLPFRIKGAVFAVAFAIRSAPTFHLLDLSWLLLRFQDRYIREGDYNRFNLLNLSYRIGIRGTYGLLIYDSGLQGVYEKLAAEHLSLLHGVPVSSWPDDVDYPQDINVSKLLRRVL